MEKWIKKAALGVTGVAVIVGLTACGHPSPEEKQQRALKMMTHKLDLTEQQKPYAESLVKAFSDMKTEMRATRQQQLPEIKALLKSDSVDENQVLSLLADHQRIISDNQQTIASKVVDLHGQLTQEQKDDLVALLEKMNKRFNH